MKTTYHTVDTVELRKVMIDRGFVSIVQLANASNTNRNTLSLILRGNMLPSSDIMYKLSDTLKMTPEQAGKIFFAPNLHSA